METTTAPNDTLPFAAAVDDTTGQNIRLAAST